MRVAIDKYLDKGPNFIKYGGTAHTNSLITFSPRQQEALVQEVHKRGLIAETHSTNPEPLRISVLAGIDLIQHPEVHNVPIPADLVKLIVDRQVICSILSNSITGKAWKDYQKAQSRADSAKADSPVLPRRAASCEAACHLQNSRFTNLLNSSHSISKGRPHARRLS